MIWGAQWTLLIQSRYVFSRNNAEIMSRPAHKVKKERIILTIYSQHWHLTGFIKWWRRSEC